MMVQALFWFHPLVWWIGARLVDERERACDEAVVRLGHEPRVYAENDPGGLPHFPRVTPAVRRGRHGVESADAHRAHHAGRRARKR